MLESQVSSLAVYCVRLRHDRSVQYWVLSHGKHRIAFILSASETNKSTLGFHLFAIKSDRHLKVQVFKLIWREIKKKRVNKELKFPEKIVLFHIRLKALY